MYSAVNLSEHIVTKCVLDDHAISNLQLQKILYYVQKHFLQTKGIAAFSEAIEAWPFGPVVPAVYYKFCGFGAMPITITFEQERIGKIDPDDKRAIDDIVVEKRPLKPWDLVNDVHKKGGAWDTIYQEGLGNHEQIPQSLISKDR